jgi:hypothetical protein
MKKEREGGSQILPDVSYLMDPRAIRQDPHPPTRIGEIHQPPVVLSHGPKRYCCENISGDPHHV